MDWTTVVLIGVVFVQLLTIAVTFIRLSDLEYWVDAHMREHEEKK